MITLPTTSMGSLRHFLNEHRDLMFRYIVREINRCVDENARASLVTLFQFGETNFIVACRKPQYTTLLDEAMVFFKKKELYEDAALCRDLLRRLHSEADMRAVEDFLKTIG